MDFKCVKWPDGKRIAIMLAFDIDGETLWMSRGKEHITNFSRGRYSTLQAIPRILRMLEEEGVPATFFTPAWNAEKYPDVIREITRLGHEIGYHGYLHEVFTDGEKENEQMEKAEAIIEEITGSRPVGNRAPSGNVYPYSLQLWLDRGEIYSSNWRDSDGPFIHEVDGKPVPLVELPKDSILDDTAYDMYTECEPVHFNLRSGEEMAAVWKEEFDALAEENRMINFVMHPQFIGRPHNICHLRRLIQYMKENGAWFATNAQVAEYILKQNGIERE